MTSKDETLRHRCLAMLATFENLPPQEEVRFIPIESGVWNNIMFEIHINDKVYYFKSYQKFKNIPNYSPPHIPTRQRAKVALSIQEFAYHSFRTETQQLVPAILASDDTGFIMEAVSQSNDLLSHLSKGICSESVITILAAGLASFHNNSIALTLPKELEDTRFRDYKVSLQYDNIASEIGSKEGQILRDFAKKYKRKGSTVVHGDLNSKNVLVSPTNVHVIDFEQAHLGSPAYDVAFILSELCIASLQYKSLREIPHLFVKKYLDTLMEFNKTETMRETTLHLAAQILYRFKGPSHKVWTSYVNEGVKQKAMHRAISTISENPLPINEVFLKWMKS